MGFQIIEVYTKGRELIQNVNTVNSPILIINYIGCLPFLSIYLIQRWDSGNWESRLFMLFIVCSYTSPFLFAAHAAQQVNAFLNPD